MSLAAYIMALGQFHENAFRQRHGSYQMYVPGRSLLWCREPAVGELEAVICLRLVALPQVLRDVHLALPKYHSWIQQVLAPVLCEHTIQSPVRYVYVWAVGS